MNVALRRRFLANRFDDGDRHRTVRSNPLHRMRPLEAAGRVDLRSPLGRRGGAADRFTPRHKGHCSSGEFQRTSCVCGLGLALALVSGCSGASQQVTPVTVPTALSAAASGSTATTVLPDPRVLVLERWQQAEDAYDAAVTAPGGPDSEAPDLQRTMTGHQLDYVRTFLATAKTEGYLGRGSNGHGNPVVTISSPTQATVVSCLSDGTYFVEVATGKPAPGIAGKPGPTPATIRSTMVLDALGVWRMSDSVVKEGTCPAG